MSPVDESRRKKIGNALPKAANASPPPGNTTFCVPSTNTPAGPMESVWNAVGP